MPPRRRRSGPGPGCRRRRDEPELCHGAMDAVDGAVEPSAQQPVAPYSMEQVVGEIGQKRASVDQQQLAGRRGPAVLGAAVAPSGQDLLDLVDGGFDGLATEDAPGQGRTMEPADAVQVGEPGQQIAVGQDVGACALCRASPSTAGGTPRRWCRSGLSSPRRSTARTPYPVAHCVSAPGRWRRSRISAQRTCRSLRSVISGNQLLISFDQSSSLIGGPPGASPARSAGRRYFRTVFGSTPSDMATSFLERPAYQWTKISAMSTTANVLLAIGCPSAFRTVGGQRDDECRAPRPGPSRPAAVLPQGTKHP